LTDTRIFSPLLYQLSYQANKLDYKIYNDFKIWSIIFSKSNESLINYTHVNYITFYTFQSF